jgi:DNA-binding beta-propeller fold protein YncE
MDKRITMNLTTRREPFVFLFVLLFFVILSAVSDAQELFPVPSPAPPDSRGPNYLNGPGPGLSDTINAQREFRLGVQAYNRYAFNEAILAFEKSLSFRPGEELTLEWLGRAYYRSGLEDTAISQWQSALGQSSSSFAQVLLRSRIETVRNRRSLIPLVSFAAGELRFVESGRYPGRTENGLYFRQPSSVLPMEDGTAWVAAYGSNELVRIDVNGLIRRRVRGPVNGFDRPYDVVKAPDGRLYVSEYRGGRVSVLSAGGDWLAYVGSRGRGDGMFVGPQNLAVDEDGYLYVVDYGNRRISKFDPEGNFLFSFGKKEYGFNGLLSPTGIVCLDQRVFVADGVHKKIYSFDRNGTYTGVLVEEGLGGPESLRLAFGGKLLVADTNRVLLVDPDSSVVTELGLIGGGAVRITGAGLDRNGNILAANFQGDEVTVMTEVDDMASGFFVQIDRVIADNFPSVTVELSVQDRNRRPIVGLDGRNFILSENNRAAAGQTFLGAAYLSENYDVSVLFERSPETAALRDDLAAALRDINATASAETRAPRIVSVVSAGQTPVRERLGAGASGLAAAARGGAYSPYWRFDQGLRLAATDLLPGEKKRAVVFVGSGSPGEFGFESYSLSELASYLANNGIAFYAIIVGNGRVSGELQYLCEETGGEAVDLYRPLGIGPAIRSITEKGSGSYALRYRSSLPTNFGNDYLPIEAEVYLLERSGRDRTGYFAPLE